MVRSVLCFAAIVSLGLTSAATAGSGGTVKGKFVLDGDIPSLPPIVAQGAQVPDAATCSAEAIPNETYVVSEKGEVANIIVYLRRTPDDMPEEALKTPEEAAVLDQDGCVFTPHVLVAQAGQDVILKSSDPVAHNVRINFFNNSGVNEIIPGNGKTEKEFELGESSPTRVACDIHPYMQSWIMVTEHPYVAVSDAEGNFEIKNLPEGEHKFTCWHEADGGRYVTKKLEVEIEEGETTDLGTLTLTWDDGDNEQVFEYDD